MAHWTSTIINNGKAGEREMTLVGEKNLGIQPIIPDIPLAYIIILYTYYYSYRPSMSYIISSSLDLV